MKAQSKDLAFLQHAVDLAAEASADGRHGPFGAVIVKEGRIVAEGWNQVVAANDPTAHAEIVAIRAACAALGRHELRGCTLYTSCEPCPMCAAAIYWARLDRVVYAADRNDAAAAGFDDALIFEALSFPPIRRRLPFTQALAEEGRKILVNWAANPLRIPY